MNATKADLLEIIKSLPDDAALWFEASRGTHEDSPLDGFRRLMPNNTMTITIRVNGGAQDTRTGLVALMARLGV